jgi:hypothetical protein
MPPVGRRLCLGVQGSGIILPKEEADEKQQEEMWPTGTAVFTKASLLFVAPCHVSVFGNR